MCSSCFNRFLFHKYQPALASQNPELIPANEVWDKVMFLHVSVPAGNGAGGLVCIPECNGAGRGWCVSQKAIGWVVHIQLECVLVIFRCHLKVGCLQESFQSIFSC